MSRLNRIWQCNTISFTSKFKLYKSRVTSFLLYGCKTGPCLLTLQKGFRLSKSNAWGNFSAPPTWSTRPMTGCRARSTPLLVHRNLFWQLSRDRNLRGLGMSHATTASTKPSVRAPWRRKGEGATPQLAGARAFLLLLSVVVVIVVVVVVVVVVVYRCCCGYLLVQLFAFLFSVATTPWRRSCGTTWSNTRTRCRGEQTAGWRHPAPAKPPSPHCGWTPVLAPRNRKGQWSEPQWHRCGLGQSNGGEQTGKIESDTEFSTMHSSVSEREVSLLSLVQSGRQPAA